MLFFVIGLFFFGCGKMMIVVRFSRIVSVKKVKEKC